MDRFTQVNDKLIQLLGHPRAKMVGHELSEFTHSGDVKGDPSSVVERRLLTEFGHWIWFSLEARPLKNPSGKSNGRIIYLTDLTEKHATDFYWRENEARFRAIFDFAPMGLIQVDEEGQFIKTNHAFQKLTGYSESQLKQMSVSMIVHSDADPASAVYRDALDINFVLQQTKTKILTKYGVTVWVKLTTSQHPGTIGKNYISIVEDISDQMAFETEKERQRQILSLNAKMASLGEMAAGVAHEVNNPLAVIRTRLHLMKQDSAAGAPSLLDHLDHIERNSTRIEKIVQGLKTYSRQSSSDPFTKTEISELIDDVKALANTKYKTTKAEITYAELPNSSIDCRPAEIVQVLFNLIGNAHDAVQEHPEPWIRLEVQDHDTSIEFRIVDSGRGIPDAVAERLFDPFFTTKEVGKGTGLGLSISAGIIAKHNGRIWLDAACPNTCFVVRLPRIQKA